MSDPNSSTSPPAHTPGPWRVLQYEFDAPPSTGAFYIAGPDRVCITHRSPWPERADESLANARLIAAAPELLEAIRDYLEWGPMTGSDRDLFNGRFSQLLAKVEGTSLSEGSR